MTRSPFAPALAVLLGAAAASAVVAQTKPPSPPPAQSSAPARAKWVAPIKGLAEVQIIKSDSKHVKGEIVTNFKIKNMSSGAIALFRIDEYWYSAGEKPQIVTGDTQRYPKPILPGEVVEMATRSPAKAGAVRSQWSFSHANGKIKPKVVKQFN
jgi:hypothetical protein